MNNKIKLTKSKRVKFTNNIADDMIKKIERISVLTDYNKNKIKLQMIDIIVAVLDKFEI